MPISSADGESNLPLNSLDNNLSTTESSTADLTAFIDDVIDTSLASSILKRSQSIQEIPATSRTDASYRFPRFERRFSTSSKESPLHIVVDSNGWLVFDEHQLVDGAVLEIIDYRQRCVLFAKNLNDTPVSTNHLPKGIYQVRVTSSSSVLVSSIEL